MTRPLAAESLAGRPVTRVDGPLKVTGAARYAADNEVPDLVYGVLVCSTVARGTVERIDADTVLGDPDVIGVLSDFAGVKLPFEADQVAFFGQPVAIVVANTLEAATHAALMVDVHYRAEEQLTRIDAPEAIRQTSRQIPDYVRGGDAEQALRDAAVVTDSSYSIGRVYHNPMELPAVVAGWDGNRLTVWDKVQGVYDARQAYAAAFGVPEDHVQVNSRFVGGAFGSAAEVWPHQLLAALAARQLRRPVKVVVTRKQMYSAIGYRPSSRQRLAIGADASGHISTTIHAGDVEVCRYGASIQPFSFLGAYEDPVGDMPKFLYSSPNMRSTYRVVPLDVNVPSPMRGPGWTTGAFALESGMDDLAHRLGMDPIELRVRNEPDRDQSTGMPFSTRRLVDCFRHGAERFGWARRSATPRSNRDGDQLIGIGTAAAAFEAMRSPSEALARINADGTADVASAASDMGPGTSTPMTQIAADVLGLPFNKVRFSLGDSRLPMAPIHGGSQTLASVGSAVFGAATALRDRFIRTAVLDPGSPLNGLGPDEVAVADGRMFDVKQPSRGESYQELLSRRGWEQLDAKQTWSPGDTDERYCVRTYGAVFAEVAVDELLSTVRIRRIYGCYDVGRVINPRLAHSQAIGGMVGGMGMALLEAGDLDYRDGRVVNANMSDYIVPVNADVPALDAEFLPGGEDTIADPIGVKGLGEVVTVGVPAAIANAVFNATGTRVTDLPITLDKLL